MKNENSKICIYPDPVLLVPAEPVEEINQEIRDILEEMTHQMFLNDGIGLAAPQIGISRQLITVGLYGHLYQVVNPQICWQNARQRNVEGCLSLPNQQYEVERALEIVVEGLTPEKKKVSLLASGLLACVFQHEIDHLKGILINAIGEAVLS